MDKDEVIRQVKKALEWQFSIYSWENMIDDTDLTEGERKWAKEHTTFDIKVV